MSKVKETVEVLKDLTDFVPRDRQKYLSHAIAVLERLNKENIKKIMQVELSYYVEGECPSAERLATTLIEEVYGK